MHVIKMTNADIYNNNSFSFVHNLVNEAVGILRVIIVHTLTSHLNFKLIEK